MAEIFQWKQFSEVDLNDPFFDSLKKDYEEFNTWYNKKCIKGESALVLFDAFGVAAFLYLKEENEQIELSNNILPKKKRLKIGTLKLSERIRSQRFGEGALGIALWYWQQIEAEEIYVTAFEKHVDLINLFKRFGFEHIGFNKRGESIYAKNRGHLTYSDPYKCFPFISTNFDYAGVIPIEDNYHDSLFPYS